MARIDARIALHRSTKKLAELTAPKPDDSVEAEVRRDVEKIVKEILTKAMTRIETVLAFHDVTKRLKRNPGWKQLSKKQREDLLRDLMDAMDLDEREMNP